ncbi:MAG: hypothetical protein EZS28_054518 [Streblomastix strix]|uniref:Uncharacterized protein n=1 Tax=Streblomastix strix TaxID=222440 RepID=A0A5J4QLC6_9EUKA|nr:MAG: hypothetical protein EZS28_054518 [Streblomastix strix]
MFFSTTRKHVRGYPEIPVLSGDDILNELVKMRAMCGQVKTTKINKKTSLESAVVDLVQVMDQTLGLADNLSKFHQKLDKIDELKILEQHSDNVSSFTNEPTKIESYQSPFNAISYMLPTFHCQLSNSLPDTPQQTINSSPPRNISSLSPPSPIISLYNPSFLHQSQSQSPLRTPSSQIHFKTLLSPSGSPSAQISEIDMALNAVVYDMGLMETFAKERQ